MWFYQPVFESSPIEAHPINFFAPHVVNNKGYNIHPIYDALQDWEK